MVGQMFHFPHYIGEYVRGGQKCGHGRSPLQLGTDAYLWPKLKVRSPRAKKVVCLALSRFVKVMRGSHPYLVVVRPSCVSTS